ncbi:ABC transporter ATP-binding protein [Massilia luteola]|jgi:putative ABC transport system ATP-binding protein|uniref:ABC transporter ATP-binding protein n=1 Tax=Massilia luteola TaxID=3081751 RepID=UPI002ACC1F8A|nr:ABC transporter ATP-binding protein [Massilia sp. Gc5]
MSALFQLQQVSKTYSRGKQAVSIFDDLDLTIPEGDFVAIMGPSGSGKSTLLNLLGGIDRISTGSLRFRDEQLDGYSESRMTQWRARHVGFIFQSYNLMPMLRAAQNVELPLLLTRLNRRQRAQNVQIALDVVGLSERARHYPREMSGGQQQRVAIARALVADPDLLLCDEPTGDLDRESADAILDVLRLLNREHGKTIVMVTHDPAAAAYARRTLHLDKGVFVQKEAAHV